MENMEEINFDGGLESEVWMRARLNCLDLEERRRFEGQGKEQHVCCRMCGVARKDLRHFVLECVKQWGKSWRCRGWRVFVWS